jgi:hypothetical protein
MMKKLIIKLFRLKDISGLLIEAKKQQQKLDAKFWIERMKDKEEKLKNEHELEIQDYISQIALLDDQIEDFKKREKELDRKDFAVRKQSKENAFIATKIATKVEDFALSVMKIVGEMQGVKNEAQEHKLRIEGTK